MTEEDTAPPARRGMHINLLIARLYLLPALVVLFGLAFGAGGGYLCGLLIGAFARNHDLVANTDRFAEIGALVGVVFFLCTLVFQFLTRKK